MKKETLSEAIGHVDDVLVETAAQPVAKRERKAVHWKRWTVLAACLVLVVVGIASFPRMGSSEPPGTSDPQTPGANPSVSGYNNYNGPILPLTVLDGGESLGPTERELTLEFDAGSGSSVTAADRYTLSNPTQEDVTVEVLYPFATTLQELKETLPILSVDGQEADTQLLAGGYAGGFQGAGGEEDDLNLRPPRSYEDYAALLEDGSYLAQALAGAEDLSSIEVTVYKFTDPWGPERSDDAPNPTIHAAFSLDYSRTTVLSYGFNSGSNDPDSGVMKRGFAIHYADDPCYLIVLGEDITDLEASGYATGSYDTVPGIDAGVTIERYRCSLDEALREVCRLIADNWVEQGAWIEDLGDIPYDLFCDYLLSYGLLSEGVKTRYQSGMLEQLDFNVTDRVFYLKTEVTIPAGETAEVIAVMNKPGSHDYEHGRVGLYGYEIATALGSDLEFSTQKVTFVNLDDLEIVTQNLDYHPASGVHTVELLHGTERYYFDVRAMK